MEILRSAIPDLMGPANAAKGEFPNELTPDGAKKGGERLPDQPAGDSFFRLALSLWK